MDLWDSNLSASTNKGHLPPESKNKRCDVVRHGILSLNVPNVKFDFDVSVEDVIKVPNIEFDFNVCVNVKQPFVE